MNPFTPRRKKLGPIAVSAIFLLFGIIFLVWTVLIPWTKSRAAQNWVETPCRVVSSEVKSHSDSKGTTYSVEIAYAYKVDGREYRSDRYQFLRFSSSGRTAKAAVVAHYPKGTRTVCYVNPANPFEAVLDRRFSSIGWFALIPLVFVGVGAVGVVASLRQRPEIDAALSWQTRPDWAAGRIGSSSKTIFISSWVFAVIWNAISFPVAGAVLNDRAIQNGNYLAALAFIFPIIGVGLVVWSIRETLRWARYGESVFEMNPVPAIMGCSLNGSIHLNRPIRAEGPVELSLQCVSRFTVRDSDGNSTKEAIVWKEEQAVELTDLGCTIPVAFQIPNDASPTTVIRSGDGIFWRLEAKARVPGIDYAAKFEVPVFDATALR